MTNPTVHLNVIDVNVKMNHDGSFWDKDDFSSRRGCKGIEYIAEFEETIH
ncbi:hypothetical protein [Bacillus toyonensis]|nr:hypothetical protein [Bacillus toyonensis]